MFQRKVESYHEEYFDDIENVRNYAEADFILALPEYYAFFTYSMFYGKVIK
jgi:hypothetical protein